MPPPPHPLPFDHGKWRVAEEPLGTDRTGPWHLGYCVECRLPTWTHSAKSVERDEVLCETCHYMLVTEMAEQRVQKENRTPPKFDPFSV